MRVWLRIISLLVLLAILEAASFLKHKDEHISRHATVAIGGEAGIDVMPSPHRKVRMDMAHQACDAMKKRRFSFQDPICGDKAIIFSIQDMQRAYGVEQAFWNMAGHNDPWWAVLKGFQPGDVIPQGAKLDFYKSGSDWIENMLQLTKEHGIDAFLSTARNGTALDLGCGLGRMSNALAKFGFQRVLCVDHSSTFLNRASKELKKFSRQGVGDGRIVPDIMRRAQFIQSGPDLLCNVAAGTVDFSHSVITLQHMKPMLQVAYIEQLCDVLRPGGYGFFQIPVKLKASHGMHCNITTEPFGMDMHYTPEAELIRHLEDRGCKVLVSADTDLDHGIGPSGKSKSIAFQKQ